MSFTRYGLDRNLFDIVELLRLHDSTMEPRVDANKR